MQKVEYQIKVYIIYIPAKIAPNFTGGNGGGGGISQHFLAIISSIYNNFRKKIYNLKQNYVFNLKLKTFFIDFEFY